MGMRRQKKSNGLALLGLNLCRGPLTPVKVLSGITGSFQKDHLMKSSSVSTSISALSSFLLSFLSCFPEFRRFFRIRKVCFIITVWFFVARVFNVWINTHLIFVNVDFGCKRTSFMAGYFPLVVLALCFGTATLSFASSFPFIILAVSFDSSTLSFALPSPTLVG